MNEGTGIQWTLTKHLEDLDFADDVYLISATHSQMQRKTEKLRVVTSVVRPSRVDENHQFFFFFFFLFIFFFIARHITSYITSYITLNYGKNLHAYLLTTYIT